MPEADLLYRARILAYSPTIWSKHGGAVRHFLHFCASRTLSFFDATPSVVNLFLLHITQEGKSFKQVSLVLDGLSFLYGFYGMPNYTLDPSVHDTKTFVSKICSHPQNQKNALTSADVWNLWDSLLAKYEWFESFLLAELRTFTMCLFQHTMFCRFSDLKQIKLDNILFDADYMKIKIEKLKTDQAGRGDYVFVPNQTHGFINPHMLLCLYIQQLGDVRYSDTVYLFPLLEWSITAHAYRFSLEKTVLYSAALRAFKNLLKSAGMVPELCPTLTSHRCYHGCFFLWHAASYYWSTGLLEKL